MDLTGATALVTGGASGLGLATAQRLVESGAHVLLFDLPRSAGDQAAAAFDGAATFTPGDVTVSADVHAAIDAAPSPLRAVVNCAGIGSAARVLDRSGQATSLEEFTRVITINLIGSYNVIRLGAAAIAPLEPVGGERGVIVNTASVAAFDGQIGQAAYSASKGALVGMTLPLARDLAANLIRVVTVAPGLFDTPLLAGLPEAARQSLGAQVPHPSRLGDPDEFGALVGHIVSNPMLNGEVIRLDGAIRMAAR